jgi:hypothetical protein
MNKYSEVFYKTTVLPTINVMKRKKKAQEKGIHENSLKMKLKRLKICNHFAN